jgi:hypothetical protein
MDAAGVLMFLLLLFGLVAAMALPLVRQEPRRRRLALVVAATFDLLVVATVVYAVGAEGYTNNGRTVWEVATTAVRAGIIGAIVVALVTAGAAWLSTRRPRLTPWVAPAAIVAVVANYLALVSTLE